MAETIYHGLRGTGTGQSAKFQKFQQTYRADPVAFVHDCLWWKPGAGPTFYQDEILAYLPVKKRVCVRGPHGLGKSSLAAWAVLWFSLTRDGDDWKVPTTASVWRQLNKFLWPEIKKWGRRIRWDVVGRSPLRERDEMLDLSLKLTTGEAFALSSDKADLLEGAHADSIFYLFDEANSIPPDTWDAAEGAFSGAGEDIPGEAFALAVSTPGDPVGRFFDIQNRRPGYEDWYACHVSLEDAIRAGRISAQWAEQRLKQWGAGSAVYKNRVLGEFATSDTDGVIALANIEAANERWYQWRESGQPGIFVGLGVDVARSGNDDTTFAPRFDSDLFKAIDEIRTFSHIDTMTTTDRVTGILDGKGGYAVVDVIGLGAGVFDRLRQLGKRVFAFNASERTTRRDKTNEFGFSNTRAAGWWNLREMLEPDSGENVALPPDDELTGDLTSPRYSYVAGGKIQIESKDAIRERLGRSPDKGDAVMEILYPVVQYAASAYPGRKK